MLFETLYSIFIVIYRSFDIPLNYFHGILGNALSMLIRITELILRYAIILFCSESWLRTPRDVSAIRTAAGKAYAANQRISQRAALSIFSDLQK